MFYITTHYGCDHSFDFLYHLAWKQALAFWDEFKIGYYGANIPDRELFAEIKPYMLARTVWFKEPQIQTAIASILCQSESPLVQEVRLKALGESPLPSWAITRGWRR